MFARRRIRNQEDIEEVVQEAIMTIHGEYGRITFETSFAAWAYKVLDNRILAHLQERSRENRRLVRGIDPEVEPTTGANPADPDLKRRLLDCLRKIGKKNIRYARILNLHYQGYGTDEIYGRLGLSSATLYSILSRARVMLESCLERENPKP